jgi:hypothetical protein
MYGDEEDGLRIDDSSDEEEEDVPSKNNKNSNGINDDKIKDNKKISPEIKSTDYSSASATKTAKKDLFIGMNNDDEQLEEGELGEPMIKNFFKSSIPTQSTPKKRKTVYIFIFCIFCI